jgi:hypothetical protein
MPISNCKRCGRIYSKHLSDVCRECLTEEQDKISRLSKFISDHPGMFIEALSEKFSIPVKEIETLLINGALGSVLDFVKTQCSLCKCEMTFMNRVGYFCYTCNQLVEKESGKVTESEHRLDNILKGHSAFYKPLPGEEETYQQLCSSKNPPIPSSKRTPPQKSSRRDDGDGAKFGFKRTTRH